jgi:hypothetical protein
MTRVISRCDMARGLLHEAAGKEERSGAQLQTRYMHIEPNFTQAELSVVLWIYQLLLGSGPQTKSQRISRALGFVFRVSVFSFKIQDLGWGHETAPTQRSPS